MNIPYIPPRGWTFPTLEQIAKPEKGSIRIGPFGSALKKHEYSNEGIRVLGIEDVHPNELRSDREKFIPEAKYQELTQYTVSTGDVLVTNMGTVGRTCSVPPDTETAIISSHLIKVSLAPDLADSNYIARILNDCPLVVAQIKSKCHGAIMAGFNSSLLKSLHIPLPPLEEQKRIAAILDKADGIRRKRQQALRLTDDFLRSVFLDMFGDPVTNPKGWDLLPIGSGIESFDGGKNVAPLNADRSDGMRVLKVSAVTSGEFLEEESKSFSEDFQIPADFIVREGDLLISRANTTQLIGAVAYVWKTAGLSMLPDKLWRFVWSEPRKIHPLFMLHMARSSHFRNQLMLRATGSSGSMKNIGKTKMLEIPIPLPPYPLQLRFAKITTRLQAKINSLTESLTEAESLFASLQQRAFRGEL